SRHQLDPIAAPQDVGVHIVLGRRRAPDELVRLCKEHELLPQAPSPDARKVLQARIAAVFAGTVRVEDAEAALLEINPIELFVPPDPVKWEWPGRRRT